mmetsp:Transcript_5047/g.11013  ORF Transcript_5047/g.11013 Transcript_5047/m.11013 type:complete len:582 (-) Transcript_5047:184-1929(-)
MKLNFAIAAIGALATSNPSTVVADGNSVLPEEDIELLQSLHLGAALTTAATTAATEPPSNIVIDFDDENVGTPIEMTALSDVIELRQSEGEDHGDDAVIIMNMVTDEDEGEGVDEGVLAAALADASTTETEADVGTHPHHESKHQHHKSEKEKAKAAKAETEKHHEEEAQSMPATDVRYGLAKASKALSDDSSSMPNTSTAKSSKTTSKSSKSAKSHHSISMPHHAKSVKAVKTKSAKAHSSLSLPKHPHTAKSSKSSGKSYKSGKSHLRMSHPSDSMSYGSKATVHHPHHPKPKAHKQTHGEDDGTTEMAPMAVTLEDYVDCDVPILSFVSGEYDVTVDMEACCAANPSHPFCADDACVANLADCDCGIMLNYIDGLGALPEVEMEVAESCCNPGGNLYDMSECMEETNENLMGESEMIDTDPTASAEIVFDEGDGINDGVVESSNPTSPMTTNSATDEDGTEIPAENAVRTPDSRPNSALSDNELKYTQEVKDILLGNAHSSHSDKYTQEVKDALMGTNTHPQHKKENVEVLDALLDGGSGSALDDGEPVKASMLNGASHAVGGSTICLLASLIMYAMV